MAQIVSNIIAQGARCDGLNQAFLECNATGSPDRSNGPWQAR
jgi:hypothetical protein